MNNENYRENKSVLEKLLDHKGIILIAAGIIILQMAFMIAFMTFGKEGVKYLFDALIPFIGA